MARLADWLRLLAGDSLIMRRLNHLPLSFLSLASGPAPRPAYWRTTVTARQAEAPDALYAFTVIVLVPTSNGMAGMFHC